MSTKKVLRTFKIDPDTWKRFQALSERRTIPASALIRTLIRRELADDEYNREYYRNKLKTKGQD